MCIKLSESKYNNIEEITTLYNCEDLKLSYIDLENMKNDRKIINEHLELAEQFKMMRAIEGM